MRVSDADKVRISLLQYAHDSIIEIADVNLVKRAGAGSAAPVFFIVAIRHMKQDLLQVGFVVVEF